MKNKALQGVLEAKSFRTCSEGLSVLLSPKPGPYHHIPIITHTHTHPGHSHYRPSPRLPLALPLSPQLSRLHPVPATGELTLWPPCLQRYWQHLEIEAGRLMCVDDLKVCTL